MENGKGEVMGAKRYRNFKVGRAIPRLIRKEEGSIFALTAVGSRGTRQFHGDDGRRR